MSWQPGRTHMPARLGNLSSPSAPRRIESFVFPCLAHPTAWFGLAWTGPAAPSIAGQVRGVPGVACLAILLWLHRSPNNCRPYDHTTFDYKGDPIQSGFTQRESTQINTFHKYGTIL